MVSMAPIPRVPVSWSLGPSPSLFWIDKSEPDDKVFSRRLRQENIYATYIEIQIDITSIDSSSIPINARPFQRYAKSLRSLNLLDQRGNHVKHPSSKSIGIHAIRGEQSTRGKSLVASPWQSFVPTRLILLVLMIKLIRHLSRILQPGVSVLMTKRCMDFGASESFPKVKALRSLFSMVFETNEGTAGRCTSNSSNMFKLSWPLQFESWIERQISCDSLLLHRVKVLKTWLWTEMWWLNDGSFQKNGLLVKAGTLLTDQPLFFNATKVPHGLSFGRRGPLKDFFLIRLQRLQVYLLKPVFDSFFSWFVNAL